MKYKISFLIVIALGMAIILSSYTFQNKEGVAKISFPLGNVLVLKVGEKQMSKAVFNMNLFEGDKVKTQPQSRCEIKFKDGSIVRIDEQSIYTIEKASISDKEKNVQSELSIGKLWANVKKLTKSSDKWKLRGPSAVVAIRGTIYRMDAEADSTTLVKVYEGSVGVGSPGWQMGTVEPQKKPGPPQQIKGPEQIQGPKQVTLEEWFEIIKAQQQIMVKPDGTFQKSEFDIADDAKNSWVQWNLERDKLIE
ncbi:MAG: FecR domain-containing protein [Calditrichaceae bacterium]